MEKVTYFARSEGIALERMVRQGKFDMRVKHFHNEYEIFFLIEGERRFFFDNRAYRISKGSLILVDENSIHMTRAFSENEKGHDRIILYVDRDKMQELDRRYPKLNLVKFFRENYGVYQLNEEQQEEFTLFCQHLQKELAVRDRNSQTMIETEIIQYFISFMRSHMTPDTQSGQMENNPKYRTAYAVADYISENYTSSFTLEELAGRFFLSKYYLCRTFKEITGYGINEYINIHRIQKAKKFLEETDMSISEIAHALGYESLTYFEKVFKTYMTISPLKYRKTLDIVTYTNPETPHLMPGPETSPGKDDQAY